MAIEVEKDSSGQSYVPVPIGKLVPEKELVAAIYLKIDGKFLKFKNERDFVEEDKLNFFIEKNLKNFYVEMSQLEVFMKWITEKSAEVVDEIVEEIGEKNRSVVEKAQVVREKIFDTFTEMEIDSGIVEILQDQVREFIDGAKEMDLSKAALAKMLRHDSSFADHALNTANIAVYMAMVLGHGNSQVLEDIYMGSIFHDYAKMKVPADVLKNKSNARYNQVIQDHPKKSAETVKKFDNIRPEVVKIIEQHHEHHNGHGYPKGLKEDEIFGLAKIVSMANIFDNTVYDNRKKSKKERYRMAIKVLEYDKGKQFDPELIEKVITALKLAYGEYYISP